MKLLSGIREKFMAVNHSPSFGGLDILKYIGPGLLVTVGFIDPGNWASNLAAGADFGYSLLWVVSLSTLMLIVLQHNVAHLGIAMGLCLAEAVTCRMPALLSRTVLTTAMAASVSTSFAEVLGAAIGLNMLFGVPVKIGAFLAAGLVMILLFTNSYRRIERWIIGFVSLIGLSFIYELSLVRVDWGRAAGSWVVPSIPEGSMLVIISVLGAVVMPHNLFLHSEIIQSRQWHLRDEKIIKKQLDYELFDTLLSMIVGWAINSAMILLAAVTFFKERIKAVDLSQAELLLRPLLGASASHIFAFALLLAGLASSVTSGMAGGTIFSGFFREPYDIEDNHSRLGVCLSFIPALAIILFVDNPFRGLLYSQMLLSLQLPFTIFSQIYLTSSRAVMGKFVNPGYMKVLLLVIGGTVTYLNMRLFLSVI